MTRGLTNDELNAIRAQANADGAAVFWRVAHEVASEFGIPLSVITAKTQVSKRAALARAWVCRAAFDRGLSKSAIARLIGRDHSSVMAAIKRTRDAEPVAVFKSVRAK